MKKCLVIVFSILLWACGSTKKVTSNTVKKPVNVVADKEVKVVPTKEVVKEVEKVVVKTQKTAKTNLNSTTLAYVKQYAPLAMDEMKKFKIPASITLAQGILESGSGRSELSAKSNNHFGIKCHKGWKGARVYHDDDAKGECFRKYKYPATSFQDHSLFLSTRFRYASLFQLKEDDYKGWAKGLKKAGYATDPRYPKKLISYIEKYQLDQYDKLVLKGVFKGIPVSEEKEEKEVVEEVVQPKEYNNHGAIHVVTDEDTLYGISKRYGISVDNLKTFNNLTGNTIHQGDVLKLKPHVKRKNYHVVQQKETLYSISKQYHITIDALKKMNGLQSNNLSIGQELKVE